MDWLFSIVMGLVEGVTEFLPISSTGHLILTSELFNRPDNTAFEVGIQMGAITAIAVLYWRRLWDALRTVFAGAKEGSGVNLLWLIVAAAIPPAVLGLWLEDAIDTLFEPRTVGPALILGGFVFLAVERWRRARGTSEEECQPIEAMTIPQAFLIGLFQTVALIPGTSRSGATMVGAMLLGLRRGAAAEFSFLVGLPVLYGAALWKLWREPAVMTEGAPLGELLVASLAAFLSALVVVKPFVWFLQRHTFTPFAFYRIAAGGVVTYLAFR